MKKHPYKLDEASLNRAYQHVVEKKVPSWGMMTAYRYANTKKENKIENKKLEQDLRKMGYGFFKVEGHWQECQDEKLNYVDCPDEKLQDSIEESLFIPGITKQHVDELGKKYGQDAVIYGGKETKGNAFLLFKGGGEQNIGKFSANKVEQAYSKIKGNKTFVFQDKKQKQKSNQSSFKKFAKKTSKSDDIKMVNLVPKSVLNKTIKNPETGRTIKVKSALAYDKSSTVNKLANKLIKKSK